MGKCRCGQPAKKKDHRCSPCDWQRRLRERYGLEPEEFARLFESQSGSCPLCNQYLDLDEVGKERRVCVDHNHITGAVRGLVHGLCNKLLGIMENGIRAGHLDYLMAPPAQTRSRHDTSCAR